MAEPVGYQLLRDLTLKLCRTASGPSVSYLVWVCDDKRLVLKTLAVLRWAFMPDTDHLLSFPLVNLLWLILCVILAGLQCPDICSNILDASVRVFLDEAQ